MSAQANNPGPGPKRTSALTAGGILLAVLLALFFLHRCSTPPAAPAMHSSATTRISHTPAVSAPPLETPAATPQVKRPSAAHAHREPRAIKTAAAITAAKPAPTTPAAPNVPAASAAQEVLLDTHVNGQDFGTRLLLQHDQTLYAQAKDLSDWRMHTPNAGSVQRDGLRFYPLDAIPGITYRVDASTETLWITAPAASFVSTLVDGLFQRSPPPQTGNIGGFFNYDMYASRSPDISSQSAQLEAGIFNSWGVGVTDYLGRQSTGEARQWVRLSTTWTKDFVDSMTTLRLGDAATRAGLGGSSVLFGGVQYGTNFATQPYLVTFPLPSISGEARLPSVVDLYVNGQLTHTQQVQPGPFTVPAVPVITGTGNVQLVVRDMLGRTQVVNLPFYASASLLKSGLDDYSFSTGEIRQNYGIASNDYGPFVASGLFRRGLSDDITGEVHAGSSAGTSVAGAGGLFDLFNSGLLTTAASVSHSSLGTGIQGLVAYSHQGREFSTSLSVQVADDKFMDIGYQTGAQIPRLQMSAGVGMPLARGNASLGWLKTVFRGGGSVELATAGYGYTWDHIGSFNFNAFHSLNGPSNYGVFAFFTIPLSDRTSASVGASDNDGVTQLQASVQKGLPAGTGSGYRVQTEIGQNAITQGELDYQNDVGTYDVGAYNLAHQTTYYGEWRGGIGFLDGGVYPSRFIAGSFGLAEVPGEAGIPVYVNNQPVAHTDSEGRAFLPDLLPYQHNPVRLEPAELPLNTYIGSDNEDAVPAYRSGVVVKFPVTVIHGATLTLNTPDGKPVPAGAEVQVAGQSSVTLVGFGGQVYLENPAAQVTLTARWDNTRCVANLKVPGGGEFQPDLGVVVCKTQKSGGENGAKS